jgi:hypothetical protein
MSNEICYCPKCKAQALVAAAMDIETEACKAAGVDFKSNYAMLLIVLSAQITFRLAGLDSKALIDTIHRGEPMAEAITRKIEQEIEYASSTRH